MEIPRRKEGLHIREIEGQTVILDPEGERMHTLNETAAFIFASIDGKRSVSEISREVADHFDVNPEVATDDTRKTVEQFEELKIVV